MTSRRHPHQVAGRRSATAAPDQPADTTLLERCGLVNAAGQVVGVQTPHPDAALIVLCEDHIANLEVYNHDHGGGHNGPRWDAYARTRDAVRDAQPRTMAGWLSKARAAKADAGGLGHKDEDPEGTPAAEWCWTLINDMLDDRIA